MTEKIMHASKIGFPCNRNLWYSVNNYEEKISERSQRTFDIGTALEPLVIKWLEKDAWEVLYNPGSQSAPMELKINLSGGSLVGHPDALLFKNGQKYLVDIKTMNDRAFSLWKREGTLKKYPQYVDQLHSYAEAFYLEHGEIIEQLGIVGVNKNTSEFHIDFFPFDVERSINILRRAERIFELNDPLSPPEPGARMQDWCCSYCGYSWLCELAKKKKSDSSVGENIETTEDKEIISAMEELQHGRELQKEGKEHEKIAKEFLDEYVRKKGIKSLHGGNFILAFTEVAGKAIFDKNKFEKEHPELVRQYTTIGQSSIRYDIKEV